MEKINSITVKLRDVLIYFGVALGLTSIIKLIVGDKKEINVIGHASGLTVAWLVSRFIVGLLEDNVSVDSDWVEWTDDDLDDIDDE
ncbi:MAG: hypothetical protein NC078_06040 [Ruminococcus sp.]|nr:hypothetical protein [Ruminococcus sp.]